MNWYVVFKLFGIFHYDNSDNKEYGQQMQICSYPG